MNIESNVGINLPIIYTTWRSSQKETYIVYFMNSFYIVYHIYGKISFLYLLCFEAWQRRRKGKQMESRNSPKFVASNASCLLICIPRSIIWRQFISIWERFVGMTDARLQVSWQIECRRVWEKTRADAGSVFNKNESCRSLRFYPNSFAWSANC